MAGKKRTFSAEEAAELIFIFQQIWENWEKVLVLWQTSG
jgi:hypothetical protein